MRRLFVVMRRCINANSGDLIHPALDPVRTEELPIQFKNAYLYYADSAEDAVEKLRHTILGPDLPVSAREFTDEEYRKAFEKSDCRKVEWLKETLGLDRLDDLFDNASNKRLGRLVTAISEKFAVPVRYK